MTKNPLAAESLLGRGLTSEVYSWGEERVIKLYLPAFPLETVEREFAVTRIVQAAGVPAPQAFEIVQVSERHGIVFERVRGPSLLRSVEGRPWTLFSAARQLAELHALLHGYAAPPGLPSQREQIERWINGAVDFGDQEKERARRHLALLPAGDCICHGDFHPANILLTERGPVIIDWSTGTSGYALADVARTSNLFESASLPPGTPLTIRLLMFLGRRLLHASYLKRYFELRPGTQRELETWRVPQRAATSAWRAEQAARQSQR